MEASLSIQKGPSLPGVTFCIPVHSPQHWTLEEDGKVMATVMEARIVTVMMNMEVIKELMMKMLEMLTLW